MSVVLAAAAMRPAGEVAGAPVTVSVLPTACFDPCTVRLRARILADARNRTLELTAESEDYLRRSILQLDGADAPRMYVEVFRELPPGNYKMRARLGRSTGETFAAVSDLTVQGSTIGRSDGAARRAKREP
jgi:hypothetical protein